MDKENEIDLKSERSSFLVQDFTPKNNLLINKSGSKSSFIEDEKYEFNAPKFYDFEAGTPSTNVDSWFDTLIDTPCNNKSMVNSSIIKSPGKSIFTPPSAYETKLHNSNKDKGKEKEKEVKKLEKEKENVNNINSNDKSNTVNNSLNIKNTSTNKIANILSSWSPIDNKIHQQKINNEKSFITNTTSKTDISNLKQNRKSSGKSFESKVIDDIKMKKAKSILTIKPMNTFTTLNIEPRKEQFIKNNNIRKELFMKNDLTKLKRNEANEVEEKPEFESRINTILNYKNTLRRQSRPFKRKLKLTIPKSPNITKAVPRRSRDSWEIKPVVEKKKPKISLEKLFNKPFEIQVPHRMLPLPKFSLSSDKLRKQRLSLIKRNLIKEQESDQQKAEFHASEASNHLISNRLNGNVVERLYHIKRNVPAIEKKDNSKVFKFKARPVPKSKPFIIKRMDKPLTEAISPVLHSKIRAKERQIFDEKVHQHQLEMEKIEKEMELEKEKREKKLIKLLRKKSVHHAKPAPDPNIVFRIKPSNRQLTIPKSPSFGHQRPYRSVNMEAIHRQLGRRLRSLNSESRLSNESLLSNESMISRESKESRESRESRELKALKESEELLRVSRDSDELKEIRESMKKLNRNNNEIDHSSNSLISSSFTNHKALPNQTSSTTSKLKNTENELKINDINKNIRNIKNIKNSLLSGTSSSKLSSSSSSTRTQKSLLSIPSSSSSELSLSSTLKTSKSSIATKASSSLKHSRSSSSSSHSSLSRVKSSKLTNSHSISTSLKTSSNSLLKSSHSYNSLLNSSKANTLSSSINQNKKYSSSEKLKPVKSENDATSVEENNIIPKSLLSNINNKNNNNTENNINSVVNTTVNNDDNNNDNNNDNDNDNDKNYRNDIFNSLASDISMHSLLDDTSILNQKISKPNYPTASTIITKKIQLQQQQKQLQQKQLQRQQHHQQQKQKRLSKFQQNKKPLIKVKKEVVSPPKEITVNNNKVLNDLPNTPIKKENTSSSNNISHNGNINVTRENENTKNQNDNILDIFSPTKKRPFPVVAEQNKKRNLFFEKDNNKIKDHPNENQNEIIDKFNDNDRAFKLFETVNKHTMPIQNSKSNKTKIDSNIPSSSSSNNNLLSKKISSPQFNLLSQSKNSNNMILNSNESIIETIHERNSSKSKSILENNLNNNFDTLSKDKLISTTTSMASSMVTKTTNIHSGTTETNNINNNSFHTAINNNKPLIHDNSKNYSIRQKNRLSDVSMSIKQNILNDILSFSPLMDNTSPSPFIISEKDKQRLRKKSKSLFDSPLPDRFINDEYESRTRERKRNSRSSAEFMNKINNLKEKKIKKEDDDDHNNEKERESEIEKSIREKINQNENEKEKEKEKKNEKQKEKGKEKQKQKIQIKKEDDHLNKEYNMSKDSLLNTTPIGNIKTFKFQSVKTMKNIMNEDNEKYNDNSNNDSIYDENGSNNHNHHFNHNHNSHIQNLNRRKSQNYNSSVQWITIEEIKKSKKNHHDNDDNNNRRNTFEITPIKFNEYKQDNYELHRTPTLIDMVEESTSFDSSKENDNINQSNSSMNIEITPKKYNENEQNKYELHRSPTLLDIIENNNDSKIKEEDDDSINDSFNQSITSSQGGTTPKISEYEQDNYEIHHSPTLIDIVEDLSTTTTTSTTTITPNKINNEDLYKTPENNINIIPRHDNSESNPFIDNSNLISSFVTNITRRTSRKFRQSLI